MQTILFFDLDATLIENRFSRRVIRPLLEEIAAATGRSLSAVIREMNAENQRRQSYDPDNVLTMDWGDIVAGMAAKYAIRLSDSVDNRWLKFASPDDIEILDHAPQVLQALKTDHRQLVLATKGLSKYQEPILELTGLRQYFDDMLTPDITGYLKTSPQFFDSYRNRDARFIQIGDHFYDDVICAKRNGFYSIMRAPIIDLAACDPFDRPARLSDYLHEIQTYPPEGSEVRPDAVVVSLEELPPIITRIKENNI